MKGFKTLCLDPSELEVYCPDGTQYQILFSRMLSTYIVFMRPEGKKRWTREYHDEQYNGALTYTFDQIRNISAVFGCE